MRHLAEKDLDAWFEYANRHDCTQLFLSSEYFATANTDTLQLIKDLLVARGAASNMSVIAYVREPIAWSTSFWQQSIKSGKLRSEELRDVPWRAQYASHLGRFMDCFGKSNVTVNVFARDQLHGGSIVEDISVRLGIALGTLDVPQHSVNASLTQEAVMVADALNGFRPRKTRKRPDRRKYKAALQSIPGRQFVLTDVVQDQIVADSKADRAFLDREFGVRLHPKRQVSDPTPIAFSEEQARSMAHDIDNVIQS